MKAWAYYNDVDPRVAAWIRELIKAGHIAQGEVDERSIVDVKAEDLQGFTQHHFFAGIGGWPLALRLAGWPDDRPVWTGSCPCPPFSCAGKGQRCPDCEGRDVIPHPYKTGVFVCVLCDREWYADGRHLWPEFRRLIEHDHPPAVFGEQVASADGRVWLSGVRVTLEQLGYAVGGADLCAAGIGAPHIRQRLFWVAYSNNRGCQTGSRKGSEGSERQGRNGVSQQRSCDSRLADPDGGNAWRREQRLQQENGGCAYGMADTERHGGGQTSRGGDRKGELLLGGLIQPAGWPTPKTPTGGPNSNREERGAGGADLQEAARSGWPTPRAEDSEQTGAHHGTPDTLTSAARAGWPTPTACSGPNMSENRGKCQGGRRRRMTAQSVEGILAGWPSPTSSMMTEQDLSQAMTAGNSKRRSHYSESRILTAGWFTPNAKDENGNHSQCWVQPVKATGPISNGSPAETEKRGALNPAFPCWLMGFPPEWCDCAVTAMQSYRPLRRSSSKRLKRQESLSLFNEAI